MTSPTRSACLKGAGASAAADQLEGVSRRDERNRETTVMSALNLLRAYRYPQVAACAVGDLTPERFLDGNANTIYVVAAGHDQDALRPVILALVAAMYEAAIVKARRHGVLDPRLFILMDEAANIAPVRNLAPWLSQCGDHGIVIATIWQSIAQIDQRYGRAARDAICAASTAQVFIPPLAEPTSAGLSHRAARRGAGRQRLQLDRAGTAHAERRPSEGRAVPVAEADRPRARGARLPRPAARDRARPRLVRGPPVRTVRPTARGPRLARYLNPEDATLPSFHSAGKSALPPSPLPDRTPVLGAVILDPCPCSAGAIVAPSPTVSSTCNSMSECVGASGG